MSKSYEKNATPIEPPKDPFEAFRSLAAVRRAGKLRRKLRPHLRAALEGAMALANVLPVPKPASTVPTVDQALELRRSHLLLLLAIETALKAAESATKMLEIALEEIRKLRGSS